MRKPEDAVCLTLLVVGRYSLMPELLDFFDGNTQRLLDFIDLFGGMSVAVPSRQTMAEMARGVHIWSTLKSEKRTADVRRLADFYKIDEARVRKIFKETKREIERIDKKLG